MSTARTLHADRALFPWGYHLLFWCAYVLYRSVIRGVWPSDWDQLAVVFLDLPIKMAMVYFTIGVIVPALLTRRIAFAVSVGLAASILAILARQGLWHGLILPMYFPELSNHAGFFDITDLSGNAAMLFPVVIVAGMIAFARALVSKGQMARTSDESGKDADPRLAVQVGARVEHIELNSILMVRSDGDYCRLLTTEREVRVHSTLKSILQRLPSSFMQVHRQHAINANRVMAHTAQQVKVASQWVPIGRTFRRTVAEALSE